MSGLNKYISKKNYLGFNKIFTFAANNIKKNCMKCYKSIFTVIIVFIAFTATVKGQKDYTKEADESFKANQFYDAIPLYKKAYAKLSKNASKDEKGRLIFRVAECYRLANEPENAAKWYDRAQGRYKDPVMFLDYAEVLRKLQRYDDAIAQYKGYMDKEPNDPRGKIGVESCELSKKWKDNPTRYKVKEMKVFNSKQSDYGVAFIDQKKFSSLVFTSSRDASTGKDIDAWTGENFSDIFVSRKDRKGDWSSPVSIGKPINTELAEGAPCLNRKATEMYFTRCPREKKKKTNCQILNTTLVGNDWTEPKILPLVPDSFTVGHPFISDDELSLYFSSDYMPGGFGGKDIWVVRRASAKADWGKPENLGPKSIHPENEMFPYIRSNGDFILHQTD